MKPTTISVFEHQPLKIGEHGFSKDHHQVLESLLGNQDEKNFSYYTLIPNGVNNVDASA